MKPNCQSPDNQASRPEYSLDELLTQCDASAELSTQEREWLDAPAVGNEVP